MWNNVHKNNENIKKDIFKKINEIDEPAYVMRPFVLNNVYFKLIGINEESKYSKILININILVYLLMLFVNKGLFITYKTLDKFGAINSGKMIFENQWYRLFTSIFLNISIVDLFFTSIIIMLLGQYAESSYGKKRFLIIYLLSGFFSSIFLFCYSDSIYVSSFGAVFGILGSHLSLYFFDKNFYKNIFGRDIIIFALIQLIYSYFVKKELFYVSLAGFLVGFLVSFNYKNIFEYYLKTFSVVILRIYNENEYSKEILINEINQMFDIKEKNKDYEIRQKYIPIIFILFLSLFMIFYKLKIVGVL